MPEDGARTLSRYSFKTNELGYCGPPGADKVLLRYAALGEKKLERGAKKFLSRFPVLDSYLELVARKKGATSIFDTRVPRAIWRGEGAVAFRESDWDFLAKKFASKKLFPLAVARKVVGKIPAGAPIHHNLHVFLYGSLTGVVPRTLAVQNQCMISVAKIKSAEKGEAVAETKQVIAKGGRFVFGKPVSRKITLVRSGLSLVGDLKPGDYAAVHWGFAVEKISQKQAIDLERVTRKVFDSLNCRKAA